MIDWLKNKSKDQPDFWKSYLSKFNEKSNRYVLLSLKITNSIVSIGCFSVIENKIQIGDNYETFFIKDVLKNEKNNWIIKNKDKIVTEYEAIKGLIEYIGNAVIIGHSIIDDLEIINEILYKIKCSKLKNEALDIEIMHQKWIDNIEKRFSLLELIEIYKIPIFDKESAAENAFSISLIFLKLKSKLNLI